MTAEEALNIFKEELQKQEFDGLTGLQEYIFKQSWNHITYEEMSDKLIYGKEYSRQHIKNKGKELFDFISKVVGQKVRKKDFRVPLDNFFKHKNREKSRENAIAENLPDISTSNTEAEIDVWAKQVLKNLKPFYERRHGKVKVLGMREPLELESIYTAIQILDDAAIRSYESIKELERLYRSTNRRSFQVSNQGKRQGIQVANEEQYLMVLGGPGMGKSIFLRKVGLEATKGQQGELKQNCIPVLLELKKFTSSNLNFKDLIVKELEILGVTEANQWITEALESGKLLILLDGLDEVPKQNFRNIKTQIKNFVDRYYKNRFIVSCRLAYLHSLQQFTDV
ncbi:MAG: NACHT domain-containing protein, partial [Cyanobacteria bacterium P01_G01_bin.49]